LKLRQVNATSQKAEAIFTASLVNALSDAIIKKLSTHPLNIEREK
jgi:2,3-bisphosphoglycerate-independent phosphoglycerate mutase